MSASPGGGPASGPPDGKGTGGGPSVAEFAGAGLQFALAILLFVFLGQWLDRRLGTAPWCLMGGVFLGAGGGFYSMYRKLMAAQARDDAARNARRDGGR